MRILRWLGILGLSVGLSGCSLGYVLRQGATQVSLLLRQEPLDRAIGRLPADQADQLRLAREAKNYAQRVIGLKKTGSYEAFVQLDSNALTWVVSASRRDRLEPYLWSFPVVGAVPYKGFFDKREAEEEGRNLEKDGFDIHMRGVAAFSLLGYLGDPLYSSMLQYSRATLANLIIHELTHATVFLAGNPTFNEGFATYVGNTGAVEFLREKYGPDSPEGAAAIAQVHDDTVFSAFIQDTLGKLREYYARTDLSAAQKIAGREALFDAAREAYKRLPFRNADHRGLQGTSLNNAYLLLFDTYQRDLSRFERIRTRFDSLKAMVAFFRDEVARSKDPEAYLTAWETRERP